MTPNKFEESAGVICVHKETKDILLVHQVAGHWGFPKGHLEPGETPREAALRELYEEVGIKDVTLREEPIKKTYSFEKDGDFIEKTVTYYVGYVNSKDATIQETEISEIAWLPQKEAIERLTYSKILKDLEL